ncbi:MAG: nicotinate phosphoribosyltransferase [Rhodospirillaceae bacterium]|nr:nicotinate phosphoribosyltransferase [Rhodospirillaceae bacterium]
MDPLGSLLLTDLYQLAMAQAYLEEGANGTAVFELFVRRLPSCRQFLMTAGLDQALAFLDRSHFTAAELDWLRASERFSPRLLDYLAGFRFTGDVDAMPEGTVFFADEPILRVTAPLIEAQLVETRLLNLVHFQTIVASKAARLVLAAKGRTLIDFGLRRAHGADAGLLAARAAYLAGFDGTATLLAEPLFGIPAYGTMAHSFIQVHDSEAEAFQRFARARPKSLVLLIDTYDTEAGARKVVELAPQLAREGITVEGVRLDSGDLLALSRRVRSILDEGGLEGVRIFASGGLDEERIAALLTAGAPIDGFGIGTSLTTASDAPALDCAYKLQEYAGRPRRKRSTGKATWPGRKQVWRRYDAAGTMAGDVVSVEGDTRPGEPLLRPVMRGGRRVDPAPDLTTARAHAAAELARLPAALRALDGRGSYPVEIAPALRALAEAVDERQAATR